MKILLIGAESQVGSALLELLTTQGVVYECLNVSDALIIPIPKLLSRYRGEQFDFVVNVDHIPGFETEDLGQGELEQCNVLLPQHLAKLAENLEIPMLHLSDYQVFSGTSDKPYREEDEPHSQTLYGVTRWQGELSVQRFCHRFIILRAGTIFSEQGKNVLTQLLGQWREGKARDLSTELQFAPTPARDIARVIYAILQQLTCGAEVWGVYHYCSADVATPYDFAEVLLAARTQFFGVDNEIQIKPIDSAASKRKAQSKSDKISPTNTVMVCEKILNTFGIRQRPWRGELTRMIEQLAQAGGTD